MKVLDLEGLSKLIDNIKILVNTSMTNTLTDSKKYTDGKIDTVNSTLSNKANTSALDTHTGNTTVHITSTERTNWNNAKTHASSTHAPVDAEKNQNAFSNITVGSTTISADTTTDTLTLVGSNITITPDETNDKLTLSVANGTTSAKGIVQLTDSTSSTSTTTAATPNSVKSAYDLANTAKTNAATAQSKADSAYSLAEGKISNLSDLGLTATATELNYVDGVTSNIQTQLNGKAASSHGNHVPTTQTADNATFLRNDNTWQKITPANIGAAASSHGTHVSYSTTAPVMNGTASVGSASTVSRSDHVHPTDTSRAAASHTHSEYFDANVSRTANTVLAAPNGSAGTASFRKLVAADLPSHTHNYAPSYTYGTSALTPGSSSLATGVLYIQYE